MRLDLGVALIDGVEPGCGIAGENIARIDDQLSPIRLFGVGLDNLEGIEALDIRHGLLSERADRALTENIIASCC